MAADGTDPMAMSPQLIVQCSIATVRPLHKHNYVKINLTFVGQLTPFRP